jgi:hypothetical protein
MSDPIFGMTFPSVTPLAPPTQYPGSRQTTTVGGMNYDWIPDRGWVATGPASRIGSGFSSALAESGRGRELAAQLGRPPTWQESLGIGVPSAATTSTPVAGGGSTPRGRAADAARLSGLAAAVGAAGAEPTDWAALITALGAQADGGGYTPVSVNRGLFQLAQTPEEAEMLASELADIEARRTAGAEALRTGWGQVAETNRAAAEKARSQVMQYGDAAAAAWTDAAARARDLAGQRAQAAAAFEGRQSINISPTAGAEDFMMFMESQAPAARQYAQSRQETLASDLDWATNLAGAQGEAYAADLRRQANVMAFERAREHNIRVQERVGAERMALAQMEFQASATNAQLAQEAARRSGRSASDLQNAATTALLYGDSAGPSVLATLLNISPEQALAMYNSAKAGTLGQALQAQIAALIK